MHLAIGLKTKKHNTGESHTTTNNTNSFRKMLFIPKAKNEVIWESSVKHYPMNYFGCTDLSTTKLLISETRC